MSLPKTFFRLVALTSLLGVTAACIPRTGQQTGAAVVHRNEVSLVRLTHEVRFAPGSFELTPAEAAAVNAFLANNSVGYGDVLGIDMVSTDAAEERRQVLGEHLRLNGLAVTPMAPVIGPAPAANAAVLIVERYVVTPPDCPDWSQDSTPNYANAPSNFHGCATRANLGRMVANPYDLVEGQEFEGTNGERTTRGIEAYHDQKPTGAAKLGSQITKATTGGGGK
ncbi:MAG: CpaD family pilus assembly protein [Sphingomonadales bacterium]|nr:CpaD family pilus assembly protein [Sphingomonadales bacterium]